MDTETILRKLKGVLKEKRDRTSKQLEANQVDDETHHKRIAIRAYDLLSVELDEIIAEIREEAE